MKLIFATNNKHKHEEVQKLVGDSIKLATPSDFGITEDIPENQNTLEGNALEKARYIFSKTGVSCFADDTGLEVRALNGEPGVYSARYAGTGKDNNANIELLLENLQGITDRTARFRTVIALIINGKEFLFEGIVAGEILLKKTGEGGFGYDPVFKPDGYEISFAQMSLNEKNDISHRGRAVAKLAEFLHQNEKL
ncbi:MAG: non-canonical purine NTP diphosphatase [Rikenellaceae bacterium]|nr:non-canonical purine NTP diphosphatase [Rikenellaceae bacterium]